MNNAAEQVQSGEASVLHVKPRKRRRMGDVPPPARIVGPTTLAQRARLDMAEQARAAGLVCDVEPARNISYPHVHLRTKKVKIFGKVKVMQTKFQIRDHLHETSCFARLEGPDTIPVVWHKRVGMPTIAVMTADDFFRIIAMLEAS